MHSVRLQNGVTLLELITVVAIAAILAAVGAPYFGSFFNETRLSSTATLLMSDLNHARSEAIKRNQRVVMCVSDGSTADPQCDAVTNWRNGWLVCVDADSDDTCDCLDADNDGTCDAGNPPNTNIMDVRPAVNARLTLTSASATPIRFSPNGSSGGATLTLTASGGSTRTIAVANTGNVTKTP